MKRSAFSIVKGIAGATHADLNLVFGQYCDVFSRGILHAPIRMMDQPHVNGARVQRHQPDRLSMLGTAKYGSRVVLKENWQIDTTSHF